MSSTRNRPLLVYRHHPQPGHVDVCRSRTHVRLRSGYTAKENRMDTLIKVDLAAPATDHDVFHNRWHPDIPIVSWVEPGAQFRVECIDWTGGQIKNDNSATDVKIVDLSKVHYLSGPIGVKGAEPGDLLVVDILDVGVLPEYQWGFTGIFAKENGGGFLTNHYPEARKACWDFSGITPIQGTFRASSSRASCIRG